MKIKYIVTILAVAALSACTANSDDSSDTETSKTKFECNADSLYSFVEAQTSFGARVPNTEAHSKCVEYLSNTFKRYGAQVTLQTADLKAYDGKMLHSTNIMASFNPSNANRFLIASHYDSRPWSDEEALNVDAAKPVMGANDGASGVAVLLELARIISQDTTITMGVDLICFDSEDYGVSGVENSFCLGSQYWSQQTRINGYKAKFGILLDMVGGYNARFYREQISDYYAKDIVDMVWQRAAKAGYSDLFINETGGGVTDDHYYVNSIAGIPCIDIIDYIPGRGFPDTWHTNHDVIENISKQTLYAVCSALIATLF